MQVYGYQHLSSSSSNRLAALLPRGLCNLPFVGSRRKMKLPSCDLLGDPPFNRPHYRIIFKFGLLTCAALCFGALFMYSDYTNRFSSWEANELFQATSVTKIHCESTDKEAAVTITPAASLQARHEQVVEFQSPCRSECKPSSTGSLPRGIVSKTSNLERQPLLGFTSSRKDEVTGKDTKSLLAMAAGIKQKGVVDKIVMKFPPENFTVMIFHYDGNVDEWRDLQWSNNAIHVAAKEQTKWWFAKRFLHPDIVAEYNYIFLWDEDLGVENFHPGRYLQIVQKEGLEISQPALDTMKSEVHHRITARGRRGDVHRRAYRFSGRSPCYENSTAPPCTGWVEIMAPVFSRAAWRCSWHMIQNDLIHAWGLDYKLGYCAMGERIKNVGVVDQEYIVHHSIPSLGSYYETHPLKQPETSNKGEQASKDRLAVRERAYDELRIFNSRWDKAAKDDECWTDPFA